MMVIVRVITGHAVIVHTSCKPVGELTVPLEPFQKDTIEHEADQIPKHQGRCSDTES